MSGRDDSLSASGGEQAPIQRERELAKLRESLLEGAASPIAGEADDAYFEGLRQRVRQRVALAGGAPGGPTA